MAGRLATRQMAWVLEVVERALKRAGITGTTVDSSRLTGPLPTHSITSHSATGNPGDVPTLQANGSLAMQAPTGGGGDASDVTYTPTTVADWTGGTDPGNVGAALDQLAARTADLEGTPAGSITVREQDGSPSVSASVIEFATGTTISDEGSGVVRVTPPAGAGGSTVNLWLPDAPPVSPSAYDDEFDDGSVAAAWQAWNMPTGAAFTEDASMSCVSFPVKGGGAQESGLIRACPNSDFIVILKFDSMTMHADWVNWGLLICPSDKSNWKGVGCDCGPSGYGRFDWNGGSVPGSRSTFEWREAVFNAHYLQAKIYSDSGTWKITAYGSTTGRVWKRVINAYALGFTPAYFGLVGKYENGADGDNVVGFDWVRVFTDTSVFPRLPGAAVSMVRV